VALPERLPRAPAAPPHPAGTYWVCLTAPRGRTQIAVMSPYRGGGVLPSCGDNAAAACCRCRRQQQAKGSIGVASRHAGAAPVVNCCACYVPRLRPAVVGATPAPQLRPSLPSYCLFVLLPVPCCLPSASRSANSFAADARGLCLLREQRHALVAAAAAAAAACVWLSNVASVCALSRCLLLPTTAQQPR
jgi:hypothetical protein